jgi:hypothetical protein
MVKIQVNKMCLRDFDSCLRQQIDLYITYNNNDGLIGEIAYSAGQNKTYLTFVNSQSNVHANFTKILSFCPMPCVY